MKLQWKIGIAVLVFFTIVVVVSLLFMRPSYEFESGEVGTSPHIPPPVTSPIPPSTPSIAPHTVDRLLDEMEFATIAFNAPTSINIEDSPQIQLILSLSEAIDELKQSITEEGEKIGTNIRVSDKMEARLSGFMFQILAITPELQAVSKSERTQWKWEIHPKDKGQHRLYLTLTAHLEFDGQSTPRAIRTFSKIIEVNITTSQKINIFFKSNWQWLWAFILVPLAGWQLKRRKRQLANITS